MSNERKNINTDYDYIIHNVEITLDEEGRQFSIEWKDKEFTDRFSVAIDELPLCLRGRVKDGNSFLAGGTGAGKVGESCNLWHISRQERLEIGRSIFRFLDGDKGILKGAMETARDAGKKMLLYICACDRCEDWPFELLADGDEFLAPGDLCVIRRRSDYGKTARLKDPENRPLKLLFMSCAPVGGIRTGDCNWEEDAIRNVMEGVPIDMEVEDSGTLAGLKRKLMFRKYDIIHLSGYGGFDGNEHPYFVMENEEGGEHPVSPRELYEVALGLNPPRLVFLSMCCSQNEMSRLSADMFARILLEKFKVSAVLTWSFGIDSRQVGGGSGIFYRESARGRSIPEALWAVRKHFYTGPGEQLIDYIEKPGEDVDSPRPMLRLFSDGKPLAAMVSGNVTKTVNEFNMSLKSVGYPLPEEGGVGRRRQMQEILRVLKHSEEKAGVLIRGAAGLGKSRLALDACRRIHEYRVIIFDGKLDEFSMKETLQEFFLLEGDKEGLKILASSETFIEQLKRISTQCFRNNHYL
ncbi:MAG: CHAT domain-containing protein, partial [bacterium]|nr:CHAT domain-containing protein [bacterium]